MSEQNNSVVVPQRTLLGEVNEHITCPLCRGYYIDATTIVECLHSFCRSCIIKHLQVKSYCPVCEMMINSAKPNIKLDKALQDIVYKLVPGLFQREMERRQTFYASRPGPAASATPEQRGEDTERIIFSPEDVISFSLEYADATDTDSISSKSSDSNEPQTTPAAARRYLQCPAVVNISHLKKFLSMKFDIDSTQFAIDILYKRVPLPDYYTLMDIAYIYNWKRNEPMRFFYQIIDFVAIRNRFFDINRKGSHFRDRKSSPASTEDTNASSPAPHLNDHGSEASSGTDSPMPEDNSSKQTSDSSKQSDKLGKASGTQDNSNKAGQAPKKNDDEVEKSQFLISFELTAKSNSNSAKSSPVKNSNTENVSETTDPPSKNQTSPSKSEDSLKRKHQPLANMPEMKKLKIELEKTKLPDFPLTGNASKSSSSIKPTEAPVKPKDNENSPKTQLTPQTSKAPSAAGHGPAKESKQQHPTVKPQAPDSPATKRPITSSQNIASPKRKLNETQMPSQPPSNTPKTVSPLKLQLPKSEPPSLSSSRPVDLQKPVAKKIPDLKPSVPLPQSSQSKGQPTNKVRMDLLANNCDPTMDRSKILSQVKTSLSMQSPVSNTGDPLKSLFDSCKINIPSSLSITLTDQKQDPRNPTEPPNDPKKNVVNKNLAGANNPSSHKVPSPPVHNYIEILKLPDNDPKKPSKPDGPPDNKPNTSNKTDAVAPQPKPPKSSETSAKGPIPNLKPIADTKLGKQSSNSATTSSGYPITFQQTFEQQLQSLQSDKKPKLQKNKAQVPKLVPANPKTFNAANAAATKSNSPGTKPPPTSGNVPPVENKPSTALDLTTPSNMQSQLTPHQTKAFETMQSKAFEIANLAKKQNLASKGPPPAIPHNFSGMPYRPIPTNAPLRHPQMSNVNQMRQEKSQGGTSSSGGLSNSPRQDMPNKSNQLKSTSSPGPMSSSSYQMQPHAPPAQPSPRQTRSPSSSPKLVIAEEKQSSSDMNVNQSNQITSTQAPSNSAPKSESPKISPGPSKPVPKPMKPMPPANKMPGIRLPIPPSVRLNPTPADFISAHHALLRNMEINAWLKAQKIMTNMAHQAQNDFNKDKQ
ncbi:RAWUL domain RING finger- and WD40-associated ubiquitin-like domain-containing protein [Phthorimaea operculella]|nr:RAWUL domain RING finger- and WD40-associated ubiquitin-like domain-containing protein [Phthorimaea operculella]